MSVISQFMTYFEAFEATYLDDDWSRLTPLFAPDAIYRVEGGTDFDCEIHGRDAVFAGIKKFLDGFDRKCERRIGSIADPEVTDDSLLIRGVAYYRRCDSPELTLRLDELIEFQDGVIVRITDTYPNGIDQASREWMERWGSGLTLTYT